VFYNSGDAGLCCRRAIGTPFDNSHRYQLRNAGLSRSHAGRIGTLRYQAIACVGPPSAAGAAMRAYHHRLRALGRSDTVALFSFAKTDYSRKAMPF
jgi:hypothetical protein